MITTAEQNDPQVLTEKDAIKLLQGYALERRAALLQYPFARGVNEKLQAVDEILDKLFNAEQLLPRSACLLILKTGFHFRYIAPTATRKLFTTWDNKIEAIMSACRNYLGYRVQ